MNLSSHWSKDTIKGFWGCFWYNIFTIVTGLLFAGGGIISMFFVSQDILPASIAFVSCGCFLVFVGALLLWFLFDF